jgi:hypothetical protein
LGIPLILAQMGGTPALQQAVRSVVLPSRFAEGVDNLRLYCNMSFIGRGVGSPRPEGIGKGVLGVKKT